MSMDFKDYYATLGVARTATTEVIKRAYRKLARKYHPDVSKEPDAEARFKEVAEAHAGLIDPERRAAYDEVLRRHESGHEDGPGADRGFEFSGRGMEGQDFSKFFESLFGRAQAGERSQRGTRGPMPTQGGDHHARIEIDLIDAYQGVQRTLGLRMPVVDAQGHVGFQDRQLEVTIPAGLRDGQQLRLAGQGSPGHGAGPAGDLYLEVRLRPHPRFRVDGRDVFVDLPVAPWEAALGAAVTAPTPQGDVTLTVPPGSIAGRRLRLKGRGLPGSPPGDLYAVLSLALPAANSVPAQQAWRALAAAFPDFAPRGAQEA